MIRYILTATLLVLAIIEGWTQNYTLCNKWVDCGNSCQLLDPYYNEGVSFTWNGGNVDGKAHGQGTAVKYVNGEYESTYVGEYNHGVREGKGTFTHKDGTSKTGVFANGQLIGYGTMDSEDGETYEGEFLNYRLHGNGKFHWGNGSTFDGYWVSDTPYTGKYTAYDGKVTYLQCGVAVEKISEKQSHYSPQIGTRLTEYFNENWQRCRPNEAVYYRIITYEAPHKPKRTVKDYYITGELQGETDYAYIDYDDDGKSFREGQFKMYYKSGQLQTHAYYINNMLNGPLVDYYENGKLKAETIYSWGVKDGPSSVNYESGEPCTVAMYENDNLKSNKYLWFPENAETCFLVYKEDFEKNRKSWEYDGTNGKLEVISDNAIRLDAHPERSVTGLIDVDFSANRDHAIEITVNRKDLKENTAIGLMFGYKDWDNYCAFVISGNQFFYTQRRNGEDGDCCPWTKTEALTPDVNAFVVYNLGESMGFRINGTDILETTRPEYDGSCFCLTLANEGYTTTSLYAGELTVYESVTDESAVREYLPQTFESESENPEGWTASGSGFFIDERGYLATNYHVVEDAKTIEVTFIRNGEVESHPASVVMSDKQNDLSVLKIDTSSFKAMEPIPYNFYSRIKDTGSEVFTLGYPFVNVMGDEVKFTDGKISSKTGIQGDVTVYQISVPIQPGNSGGPLFDNLGNVVGITSSALNREYFKSENVNYAIKFSYLNSLVDALPQTIHLQTNADIADKPLTEKIKLFQDYMVCIRVK